MVLTDLHWWDSNLRSRKSYVEECYSTYEYCYNLILQIRRDNPSDGLHLVFAGDIFHKALKNRESDSQWSYRIMALRSLVDSVHCVVGNHELTYHSDNVFWTFMRKVESLNSRVSQTYARGLADVVNISDHFDVEGVRIHLMHYGTSEYSMFLSAGRNVCISHNELLCPQVITSIQDRYGVDLKTRYVSYRPFVDNSPLSKMDYVFISHMHQAIGEYLVEYDNGFKSLICYMSSIGRTNSEEILNTPTTRRIPVLLCESGNVEYSYCEMKLPEAVAIADVSLIAESKSNYQKAKERRKVRQTKINGADPVVFLEDTFGAVPEVLETFKCSGTGVVPDWMRRFL